MSHTAPGGLLAKNVEIGCALSVDGNETDARKFHYDKNVT
jgi:hypothetical protein